MGSCLFCQHVPQFKRLLERVARGEALPEERMTLRHDIAHDRVAAGLAQAAVTGLRHTGHQEEAERISAEMRRATMDIRPLAEMGRVGSAPAFASDTAAGRILAGRQTPAHGSQGTAPQTQTIPLRVSYSHPTAGSEPQSSIQPRPETSSASSARAAVETGAQPWSTASGPQSTGSLSSRTSTPSTTSNSPRRPNRPTQSHRRGEGMTAKATSSSVGAAPARGQAGGRSGGPPPMTSPFAGSGTFSSSGNSLHQGTGRAGPSIRKAE